MTAHWRRRAQELRLRHWFGYSDLLGREVHEQFGVLNRLKPVDGALVIGRVRSSNGRTVNRRQCCGRMNMNLLGCVVAFAAVKLVNVKKGGFDESKHQGTRHRNCTERSHETLILCDLPWASQTIEVPQVLQASRCRAFTRINIP